MTIIDQQEILQKYRNRFSKMEDDLLIDALNREKRNKGCTKSRILFLSALNDEIKKRNIEIEKN